MGLKVFSRKKSAANNKKVGYEPSPSGQQQQEKQQQPQGRVVDATAVRTVLPVDEVYAVSEAIPSVLPSKRRAPPPPPVPIITMIIISQRLLNK